MSSRRFDDIDLSVRAIFHAVIVASLYLLFVGHNHPGGGFVGGLVAGAAIAMRYVAGGIEAVRSLTPVRPWSILGAGVVCSAITAVAPLLGGEAPLTAHIADVHLPVFGDVHVSTTLAFDAGVYLVVVGLVLMVFEAFGDELTDRFADDSDDTPAEPAAPDAPGSSTVGPAAPGGPVDWNEIEFL